MIATSAKLGGAAGLKELLEAASETKRGALHPMTWDARKAVAELEAAAPTLARLVLELAAALEPMLRELDGHPEGLCLCDVCVALAAVEEL